jgi:hypothetical protein
LLILILNFLFIFNLLLDHNLLYSEFSEEYSVALSSALILLYSACMRWYAFFKSWSASASVSPFVSIGSKNDVITLPEIMYFNISPFFHLTITGGVGIFITFIFNYSLLIVDKVVFRNDHGEDG